MRVPLRAGEWIILKQLGTGRYNKVYKAYHHLLERAAALKIPRERKLSKTFVTEARSLAMIDHPNVMRIYQVDEHRGYPFCVMEFVDGTSLDVRLREQKNKHLEEHETLCIALGAAHGLAAAWRHDIIHRDVKPPNLLLNHDGVVKVADFGLSASRDNPDGVVAGTPWYIAPEVVKGEPIDHRTDIYSLGCTMFHMLTGKPPFTGTSVSELCAARLKQAPPWVREIDPRISTNTEDLLLKMMRRDPDERFQSYDELIERIDRARHIVEDSSAFNLRYEDLVDDRRPALRYDQTYIPAVGAV